MQGFSLGRRCLPWPLSRTRQVLGLMALPPSNRHLWSARLAPSSSRKLRGASLPAGRPAPNQSHLSFPQRPGPGFPKANPQCGDISPNLGDSGVLSSQSRNLIFSPAHIIFLGRRGVGAQSPKSAGLRKGGRRGLGGSGRLPPRAVASPRRVPPPHPPRLVGSRDWRSIPAGSCAAPGRGSGEEGPAGPASRCAHRRSAPQSPGVPARQTRGSARPAATGEGARRRDPRGAYLRAARRTCCAARSSSGKAAARGGRGPGAAPAALQELRPRRGPGPGGAAAATVPVSPPLGAAREARLSPHTSPGPRPPAPPPSVPTARSSRPGGDAPAGLATLPEQG